MTRPLVQTSKDRKVLACVALGALTGVAIGLQALDPQFILGTGGKWVRPENDFVAYLVAWNYYIVDSWRFPLFSIPAMSYPEGGNVLFNDALPLTALLTKIVYQLFGVQVNPFGWWVLLTYVLQGALAARLVCAVGIRSLLGVGAAAVFAIVNIAFVARLWHTARLEPLPPVVGARAALREPPPRPGEGRGAQRGPDADAARQRLPVRDGIRAGARHAAGAVVPRRSSREEMSRMRRLARRRRSRWVSRPGTACS